jgi:hypothetical protein
LTYPQDPTTALLPRLHLLLAQSQSAALAPAQWPRSLLARRLAQGARKVDRALLRVNLQARQFLPPIFLCRPLCLRLLHRHQLPPLRPNELRKRRQSCKLEVLSDARACQQSTRRNPCPTKSRPCPRRCIHRPRPRHRVLQSLPWRATWLQPRRVEKRLC